VVDPGLLGGCGALGFSLRKSKIATASRGSGRLWFTAKSSFLRFVLAPAWSDRHFALPEIAECNTIPVVRSDNRYGKRDY
jgi:hypothetical protein